LNGEKSSKEKIATEKEPALAFPTEGFVNKWGFIHLKSKVAEAFGAIKGQKTPITIDLQEGALVIKKAWTVETLTNWTEDQNGGK
jgi:hypothetical protein